MTILDISPPPNGVESGCLRQSDCLTRQAALRQGVRLTMLFMFILKMGKFEPGCDPMTDIREGTEEI